MNRTLAGLALLCSMSAAAQTPNISKLAGNPPDAPSQVAFDLRLSQLAADALPQAATPQTAPAQQGQSAPGSTTSQAGSTGTAT
ncbi:MAG TPA: hypothetical protein VF146_01550, partial [Bryobacteraceae bacterium]